MWIPSNLEVVRVSYSFEASEQGVHRDRALRADGTTVVNMLSLVDWGEDPVQVEICDACGTLGCAIGGYVAPRRLGPYVVLAPSTRAYFDAAEDSDRTNFRELSLIRKRGLPLIPATEWERLYDGGAPLPSTNGLRTMTWREAALAAQFEAPLRLLGDPGSRVTRFSKRVAATDPWMDPADLDRLGDPLAWGIAADAGVSMRETKDAMLYSIIVSDPMRNVVLFGSVEDAFGLYFEPGLLVFPQIRPSFGPRGRPQPFSPALSSPEDI
jgi:hypothetical protein